jgi:hypothetical protein
MFHNFWLLSLFGDERLVCFLFVELNCRDGTALSRAVLSKKGEDLWEARGDPMSKIFDRNGSLPAVT